MRCEEARELFDEYYARELNASGIQNFEGHLKMCPDCKAEYEEFKQYKAMMKSLGDVTVPEGFAKDVMDKVRKTRMEKIVPMAPAKKKWYKSVRLYGAAAAACVILAVFAGGRIDQYIQLNNPPQIVPSATPEATQMLTQAPQNRQNALDEAPANTQQPSVNAAAPAAAPKTAKPKAAALPKTNADETKQQNGEAGSSALEQETFGAQMQDGAPTATQAPEKENGQAEQVPEKAPAPSPSQAPNTKGALPPQQNDASKPENSGGSGSSGVMSASVQDNTWIETICTYRITCDNAELVMQLLEGKSTQTEIEAVLNEHGIAYEKNITEIDHTARYQALEEKLQNGDNSQETANEMQSIREKCEKEQIRFVFFRPQP